MAGTEDYKKLYVNAAKGAPGRYFIGPFGRRVSFASQQQRALNTVWALKEASAIKSGQDVAVIGAGLCGIMAATALANLGCSVWLFELRTRPLERQSRTNHRWIHPSINFWPLQKLEATAHFPFYDWFADQCSQVLRVVEKDWEQLRDRISDVLTSAKVLGVKDEGEKQLVRFSRHGNAEEERPFDAVIFAVGFGDEKVVTGCRGLSYWDEDDLFAACQAGKSIIIGGAGDGGIIDALQSVHRRFRWGRLPVELAEKLFNTGVYYKMQEAEKQAANETTAAGAIDILAERYPEMLPALDGACRRILDESLVMPDVPVRLIGNEKAPYSLRSAPIHRLMLAHAISEGAVLYEQGQLADGPRIRKADGTEEDVGYSYCIARLGPTPPLEPFLQPAEIASLREKQEALSDLIETTPYPVDYWHGFDDYPHHDPAALDFARKRFALASHYITDAFGFRLALGKDDAGAYYAIGKPNGHPPIRLPEKIFGIRALTKNEELFDGLAS